jgi:hypothetical protein
MCSCNPSAPHIAVLTDHYRRYINFNVSTTHADFYEKRGESYEIQELFWSISVAMAPPILSKK